MIVSVVLGHYLFSLDTLLGKMKAGIALDGLNLKLIKNLLSLALLVA